MIEVAIEAARQAGNLANNFFTSQLKVSYKRKGHSSPVTQADKQAELLARKIISKKFPNHGFIGEEFGKTKPGAKYHWVIDPIDGTRDFIRGIPFWSTLIAVMENGKPIIGVCFYPASQELYTAQKNKGTYLNGKKIKLSKISKLNLSYLTISAAHHFASHKLVTQMVKLSEVAGASRYPSNFGYSLLWKGKSEGYVAARGKIWDWAAPAIITEEAGGKYTDFKGNYSFDSDCALLTNGLIHNQVLKILNS